MLSGRLYNSSSYCLDYSINYCDGLPSASLRAVVNDASLELVQASTIFGTNKEDSSVSLAIKRFGYPASIVFLMLTLAVFLAVPELRQESDFSNSGPTSEYGFSFIAGFAWQDGHKHRGQPDGRLPLPVHWHFPICVCVKV